MELLFFLLLQASATGVLYNVDGVGTPSGSPMMKQWAFSYSLLKPETALTFTPLAGELAFNVLASKCRKNYATDYILSDINWLLGPSGTKLNGSSMAVVPFFASALVIPYNVPEVTAAGGRIILTRELIFQIFTENITMWNDSRIQAENQAIKDILPSKRIQVVVRSDNSGSTVSLASLITAVDRENHTTDPGYPHWRGLSYNFQGRLYKNLTFTTSAFHMTSTVLTNSYSLGYVTLSYADQAGLAYALLKNRANEPVEPDSANVAAAIEVALQIAPLTGVSNGPAADRPGKNSYPFPTIVYIAIQKYVNVDCEQRREVFKFLNWILTTDAAQAQISGTIGYTPFNSNQKKLVLNQLRNVTCQGTLLLRDEYQESSSTLLRQAAMSIAAILMTIVLIIGVAMGLKRNNRITKAAGLAFASCFLIGCLLNYVSVFVWAQIPSTDMICRARYILVALGYTLLLGSMFAKCWEIRKIFARAQSGDISPIQELPWWKFCQVFFAVISVNAILLLALGVADPPKTMVHRINDLDLISVHMCYVFYVKTWAGLEFTYFSCLVLWGGYLAYSTREIWEKYNYPNESRSILLSIYNLVFCFCILLPMMTLLHGDLEVIFFFVATAIVFPTTFALFMVYGPKMVAFLSSSFKGSRASQGGATKQSKRKESGGGQVVTDRTAKKHRDHRDEIILEEEEQHAPPGEQGRQSPQSFEVGSLALSTEWRVLRHPVEDTPSPDTH